DGGEHEVEQHDVRGAVARQAHAIAPEAARQHREPLELQGGAQPAHDIGPVPQHQHAPARGPPPPQATPPTHSAARSSGAGVTTGAAGTCTVKVAPRPGVLSTVTWPPCASAMCLTSDRPMPLPRTLRVRALVAR